MTIYFDHNISQYLARAFDLIQQPENVKLKTKIEVKAMKDVFGEGVEDEDWISKSRGRCVCGHAGFQYSPD